MYAEKAKNAFKKAAFRIDQAASFLPGDSIKKALIYQC
jgi:hypothetical protein